MATKRPRRWNLDDEMSVILYTKIFVTQKQEPEPFSTEHFVALAHAKYFTAK